MRSELKLEENKSKHLQVQQIIKRDTFCEHSCEQEIIKMSSNNVALELMHGMLIKFRAFKMPTEDVEGEYKSLMAVWNHVKAVIEEQSDEWRIEYVEMTNELSTTAHLIRQQFEAELQELQLLKDEDKNESSSGQPNEKMEVDAPSEKQQNVQVVDQAIDVDEQLDLSSNVQANASAATASAHSSAMTSDVSEADKVQQTADEPELPMVEQPKVQTVKQQPQSLPARQASSTAVKAKELRYNAATLNDINKLLRELQNIPMLPEQATGNDINRLRESIAGAVERVRYAGIQIETLYPVIMAQVVQKFNQATKVLWSYQITLNARLSFSDLRAFLETQEEMLISGWKPGCYEPKERRASVRANDPWAGAWGEASGSEDASKGAVPKKKKMASTEQATSKSQVANCDCCGGKHRIFRCDFFLRLPLAMRKNWCELKGYCKNCLKNSHKTEQCTENGCKNCVMDGVREKHNSVLCPRRTLEN